MFRITLESVRFQSTHPPRVRHAPKRRGGRNPTFNPRTHLGCDLDIYCKIKPQTGLSIHAPT
ncbi:hypothetical protein DJ90_5987 [Paenibacillus macerans]|uniref:Uncharacterized protein n=1 Tax=Paenibacillus macerans TaxID=44252 RepID=A0A090Y7L7_PAEMA|nr:hypothetical protein DJ90_5987 [Paenibacillus macerans]